MCYLGPSETCVITFELTKSKSTLQMSTLLEDVTKRLEGITESLTAVRKRSDKG